MPRREHEPHGSPKWLWPGLWAAQGGSTCQIFSAPDRRCPQRDVRTDGADVFQSGRPEKERGAGNRGYRDDACQPIPQPAALNPRQRGTARVAEICAKSRPE
jgi:hypothetical protein